MLTSIMFDSPKPKITLILGIVGVILLILWVGFLSWGLHRSTQEWARVIPGIDLAESDLGSLPPAWAATVAAKFLSLLTAILIAAAILYRFRAPFTNPEFRMRIFAATMTIAVGCALCEDLLFRGVHSTWYKVEVMMTHPETVPVFGQRLLLIWPAVFLRFIIPRLSYIQAYLVVQCVAIFLTVYALGRWSALFVGRNLAWIGQVLFAVFYFPTDVFFQAHDIGVALTYTVCFYLLYRRHYWLYILAFCVGVLNHQNILLLIPTAAAVMWTRDRWDTILRVCAVNAVMYFTIQFILNRMVPVPLTHEYGIWVNMNQLTSLPRTMIFGLMLMVPWWTGAAAFFKNADPFLKAASILLPMEIGIYFVFGRLNEARLFHGFLPILIGIYLCALREFRIERAQS